MNFITVDITGELNFVLTDDQSRVLAIINVKESAESIDKQIIEAITDDKGEPFNEFETELHITNAGSISELSFDASLEGEDEIYSETFYLTRTEVYR